jgi:glycosyltransferase involved in cell wall biosynthesis
MRRILYVDLGAAVGGSVISLYYLVRGLDRRRYQPHLLLHAENPYVARFRALGAEVSTTGTVLRGLGGTAGQGSGAEEWSAVRGSRFLGALKRFPGGPALVHGVGFYLRQVPALRRRRDELMALMRAAQPDLVHLNDALPVQRAAAWAARQLKLPALCHIRSLEQRNAFDQWLSRSLCGYICISRAVEVHLRTLPGRIGPSWVVYNGLDVADYAPLLDAPNPRAALGLAAEDQVIGCVGRLVPWKGQAVFLKALARLAPRYPHLRGLVVGAAEGKDEPYRRELEALAQASGLQERLVWTGYREDVARLMGAMDVLAHTSSAPEPFGRVLIEGMAAGVAVIGTAAGAVSEIIRDGESGLLVPPGDDAALASAIARLLDHPQERAALVATARREVEERFGAASTARGVERVYEELLP